MAGITGNVTTYRAKATNRPTGRWATPWMILSSEARHIEPLGCGDCMDWLEAAKFFGTIGGLVSIPTTLFVMYDRV